MDRQPGGWRGGVQGIMKSVVPTKRLTAKQTHMCAPHGAQTPPVMTVTVVINGLVTYAPVVHADLVPDLLLSENVSHVVQARWLRWGGTRHAINEEKVTTQREMDTQPCQSCCEHTAHVLGPPTTLLPVEARDQPVEGSIETKARPALQHTPTLARRAK